MRLNGYEIRFSEVLNTKKVYTPFQSVTKLQRLNTLPGSVTSRCFGNPLLFSVETWQQIWSKTKLTLLYINFNPKLFSIIFSCGKYIKPGRPTSGETYQVELPAQYHKDMKVEMNHKRLIMIFNLSTENENPSSHSLLFCKRIYGSCYTPSGYLKIPFQTKTMNYFIYSDF